MGADIYYGYVPYLGPPRWSAMHIISKKALKECWERHPDSEQPLRAWHSRVSGLLWQTPPDVTASYGNARTLPDSRAIFPIKGGNYRIVVVILYRIGRVLIRFAGTHAEYDKIDAETI